ncbi:hypothetical protein [Agromyces sp. PvR057]|uniref:hypothetical protein n=1 Tax=Agromyces sp. PvR057 TaxID=3156403 RepID=UPI003390F19A
MQPPTPGPIGFFDDEDAAARRNSVPAAARAPDWMNAPEDELPARIILDEFIARTNAAALVLREVRVYSTGFEVVVDWALRRTDEEAKWHQLVDSATRSVGWIRQPEGGDTSLRFGITPTHGTKLPLAGDVIANEGGPESVRPPTVMPRRAGGHGNDYRFTGSGGLWVWAPETMRGELTFVAEWAQADIHAADVVLDGDAIADAANRARRFWNDSDQN